MKKPQAPRSRGVRVWPLLLVAAVAGGVGGVLLAKRGTKTEGEMLEEADRLAEKAMPLGSPAPARAFVDMMAPDPESLRGIPPYPGANPRKILGGKQGDEINAISWFSTQDSVDKVLSFYEQTYLAANVVYASHRYNARRGYVSWIEPRRPADGGDRGPGEGILHMVSASDEGSQTMVFVSATEPWKMLGRVHPLPKGVKLPPGARPQVINLGEPGYERYSIFASFASMPKDALVEFLVKAFAEEGWTLEEKLTAPNGRVSLQGRLNQMVQLAVVDGTQLSSQVLITIEARPRQGVQ